MKMTKQDLIYEVRDYFNITLGLMLYTLGFTVFLLPYEIVTGGIAGIGAIIFYSTGFPVHARIGSRDCGSARWHIL